MENKIIRECDMFSRSITFWNTNTADLATVLKGPGYLAKLVANTKKLVDYGATQKSTKVTAQNAKIMLAVFVFSCLTSRLASRYSSAQGSATAKQGTYRP